MKTRWDLALLYKNPKDPNIEKDIRLIERAYAKFAKKYRDRIDYLQDEHALLEALENYEKLLAHTGGSKPLKYFAFRKELNSTDQHAEAMLARLQNRLTKAGNQVLFFDLNLGQINKRRQNSFLKSKTLQKYHYFLKRIFETSKYDLSEPEERILNLKSLPSRSLWIDGAEKLLNSQIIEFKGKTLPINKAIGILNNLPRTARRSLSDKIMAKLRDISDFPESEINAVFTDKKINDELRGFSKPYSATILSYENDERAVIKLVEAVTSRFDISHRFHRLKAKLLGLKFLEYADQVAPVGKQKRKISFSKAARIVQGAFGEADPAYAVVLKQFLANGQIDVFPKKGKGGGAFCSGGINLPTYVLLNHANDFHSMQTLAHEMGHAIHTERSKKQPPVYQGYTISVAETASTFFEAMVFEHVFKTLTEKERIVALHDKIQDDISSIFRQIAFFNFELELHNRVRKEGSVAKAAIAELMRKHLTSYYGRAVRLKENDGYLFVRISHIRMPFYVYSYAYGQLISKVLFKRYREDPEYIKKIDRFLSAGGSRSPEQIFSDIGIDTTQTTLFEKGLESIEQDVTRLEKLMKK